MMLSIQARILLALSLLGLILLMVSFLFVKHKENELIEQVMLEEVKDSADSYFDSINILMLTGQMSNRHMLKDKILSRPGVVRARVIRGEKVVTLFGAGDIDQKPLDELDERALQGVKYTGIAETDEGRLLTVVTPLVASEDFRGTNCLGCHQAENGDILGAVRIDYSLAHVDQEVSENLLMNLLIQIVVFIIGFVIIGYIIRKIIIKPLKNLGNAIHQIEQNTDLTYQIEVKQLDELGVVAESFNRMLTKIKSSLNKVASATQELNKTSIIISNTSDSTSKATLDQKQNADMVATSMHQMDSIAKEVKQNTFETAQKSEEANQQTKKGIASALSTVTSILELKDDIERSASVIQILDQKTQDVSKVLEVISTIADQTNLLALNAAIEAARAGESGRGFAVVADEVRSLASKTSDSTQVIQDTLQQLQAEVEKAVEAMEYACNSAEQRSQQVNDVAEALKIIANFVAEINDLNSQVASAADEQSQAVENIINQSVVSIKGNAETTSQEAEKSKQVAFELVELANQLESRVGEFKI